MVKVKKFAYKFYRFINHLPFVNKISKKCSITNKGSILVGCKIISHSKTNHIIFPSNGYFKNCTFELYGESEKFIFHDGIRAYNASFYAEDRCSAIIVGNSTFSGKIHIAATEGKKINIGDNCLFSSEVVIRNGDSHSILNEEHERINIADDVNIGNHCWIGHRVIILKGVSLNNHTVIGTGSVVTKRFVEQNIIIGGVPAKILKTGITWNEKRL